MDLDLYQAETARIADQQLALLTAARQILASGRSLSALEQSGVLHALQVLIENAILLVTAIVLVLLLMIDLPKGLEQAFLQTIYAIDEDKRMPYINTAERVGMEKGLKQGRQEGLQEGEQKGRQEGQHQGIEGTLRKQITLKFGGLPAWADERLTQATDAQLDVWVARILTADSLEGLLGD